MLIDAVGDEAHDAHLGSAAGTHEGVDFDQLRPSAPEGPAVRALPLASRGLALGGDSAGAAAFFHRVNPLALGLLGLVVPPLACVNDLVGQNLGARKPDRAERAVWLTGFYNMAFLAPVTVVFVFFADELVAFFSDDPGVRALAAQ